MTPDFFVLVCAAGGLALFFILQMLIFRLIHPEAVFSAIMIVFAVSSLLFLSLVAFLIFNRFDTLPVFDRLFMLLLGYFIFGLGAFVYILCMFGPSETSLRIRIVREIYESQDGTLTREGLAQRYNASTVLERRLERLRRSREVMVVDGKYRLIQKTNVFFMIDAVANAIASLINRKS